MERHTIVDHAPWSPAQAVALLIGAFYVIIGAIALAQGGFNDVTNHTQVMGIHTTPLAGIMHLLFGAFMLMAGAVPGAGRGTMAFLGAIALVWGVIVAASAPVFHTGLGTHYSHGWLYIILGGASLVAAFAAPIFSGTDRFARRF